MHEDHFIIGRQNGVELLVTDRGQLGHVPGVPLVHRDVDHPKCALQNKRWGRRCRKQLL